MGSFRYGKLSPLERGWTGAKMPGRYIGAPDPVGEGLYLIIDKNQQQSGCLIVE